MKKILATVSLCLAPIMSQAMPKDFAGLGLGYSEACRSKYSPSFAGGDCIDPNVAVRGFIGHEFNEYFSLEASLDASFDGGNIFDAALEIFLSDPDNTDDNSTTTTTKQTNRWSVVTVAASAFFHLPLSDDFALFAGPTLGSSLTDFDYDVKYFGSSDSWEPAHSEIGLNYGWAAGVDIMKNSSGFLRVQWQNWRSLDTNAAQNGQFNSNTLTINVVGYH